jgi:hypothetical protein
MELVAAHFLETTADAEQEKFKERKRKEEDDKLKGEITNIPPCIVCANVTYFPNAYSNTVKLSL